MARGQRKIPKRKITPDALHGSVIVSKFVNNLMWDGKKSVAMRMMYDSFDIIEKKTGKKAIDVFNAAIKNVAPAVKVKSRRVGGSNYQVPVEVKKDQKIMYAIKWILAAVRAKKGKSTAEELAEEFMLAAENQGTAVKKREDTHRMAESNRAYAHFARF